MKKLIQNFLVIAIAAIVIGVAIAIPSSPTPTKQSWMSCCERLPKGAKCSDAETRAECYRACQAGCGDKDDINGKKCRQFCDIWL
jgi:hypothetical protein